MFRRSNSGGFFSCEEKHILRRVQQNINENKFMNMEIVTK
jgi:hypothetical protein